MGTFLGDLWDEFTAIPTQVLDRLGINFVGPAGAIGITVLEELYLVGSPYKKVILVGTPDIVIQATSIPLAAAEIFLPRTRKMSSEERWLARMVYGNSLPLDSIIFSNVEGMNGRWFVIPNALGQPIVNIGNAFEDPIRHTDNIYREFGQTLIHELGHAWQIHHEGSLDYIIDAAPPQITGDAVYDPGDGIKPWNDYSIEQQATIVDIWYSGINAFSGVTLPAPCSRGSNYYKHVRNTINAGNEPPVLQTLSVREIAKSKFDQEGGFSVSSRFPRYNSGSLRNRLIGLKK